MNLSLRERLERLEQIPAIDRVSSGSPAGFRLGWTRGDEVRTIDATFVLARRGLTVLLAKRAVEAMVEQGSVTVELPTVEDAQAVVRELAAAGVSASVVKAHAPSPSPAG